MRILLFKHKKSQDKRRKIISCTETFEKSMVRTVIRRHFICFVKEIKDTNFRKPESILKVVKEKNRKLLLERFYCKLKGGFYLTYNGRIFLVLFTHSLKISLQALSTVVQYS